jgi:succinoglycan biosynthesis protein ExoL
LVQLAFFGHDANDAAVRRRIAAFMSAGAHVRGYTMRRGAFLAPPEWDNVDLGATVDADFRQRITALIRARPILRHEAPALRGADIVYARNLDMLALAHWARGMSGSRARLVYECLDVHRFMTKANPIGAAMRAVERRLLKDTDLVIVSSPAFVREYFDVRHPGKAHTLLVENRVPPGFEYGPRPQTRAPHSGPIRLGWFGNLRCRRSLALLLDLAAQFPERIEIVMRGAPTKTDLGDFEARIANRPNVRFGGRYRWPDDLASLYEDVDLVWAGDFHDPGANSKWLLPNRLYEGGYYGAPPLAPADSETGRWIEARGFGFTLPEPLEETFPEFFSSLDHHALDMARARLLSAPRETFAQPASELTEIIQAALATGPRS